jgi:methylmalonyl-CoA mutase N-terminal domain/subunit
MERSRLSDRVDQPKASRNRSRPTVRDPSGSRGGSRAASPATGVDGAVERWRRERLEPELERVPPRRRQFETLSGLEIDDLYTPGHISALHYERDLGYPGEYPFTRGVHASMYRARPWTIRQVAGFGRAEDTNRRYKYLLSHGETGLSTDFDLPTLLGHDSDHPVFTKEVGKIGVAIDTVEDAHALFDGIPLDRVSTSLTITAPAAILIAMYRVVGEERGLAGAVLTGTAQNDILKEYTAQNEYIFPPRPSVELVVDTMEYSAAAMPRFNPVSVSGYHIREAGSTAVEELALTLAAGVTYLEHAAARGIDLDLVAPRLSFFFDIHNDLFEEIAKFRAARRLWAKLTRDRLGCRDPRSWRLRTHAQTAGVSLTAQQPLNNVARTAVQALAGILGGVQSMHTNSLDEAFAIPSEEAIKVAVRTQQILLHESGAADVVDPLAGSYYVEALTNRVEGEAESLIARIDELGGLIEAIESGFVKRTIGESAWDQQANVESGKRIIVGVNAFEDQDRSMSAVELFQLDPEARDRQLARLSRVKRQRESRRVLSALNAIEDDARAGSRSLMPAIEEAVRARCTVGEICDALRTIWGNYQPPTEI